MLVSADELRRLRRQRGLTQSELAKKSGVSQSLVARVEKGTVDPRLSTLKKISNVLSEESLSIDSIMSKPVLYTTPDETVAQAISKMEHFGISQLPVMDKSKPVGAVVDSILLKRMQSSSPARLKRKKVRDVMTKAFPTVDISAPLDSLYSLLQKRSAVLVLDDGAVAGIVSKADVLRLMR